MNTPEGGGVRLAALMAALSTATDLAMGQPMENAMASCVVAVRLGEALGVDAPTLRDTYYLALLRYIGCNADVSWLASIAGDELALRREVAKVDFADQPALLAITLRSVVRAHAGRGTLATVQAVVRALAQLPQLRASFFPGHCEVAARLAGRMGFPPSFVQCVGQLYARWDGRGVPALRGGQVALPMQLVALAQDAVNLHAVGGTDAVIAMTHARSGKAHSPRLAARLRECWPALAPGPAEPPLWDQVLGLEPGPPAWLHGDSLDAALQAMADFADLKSPWHLGHSRRVALLAEQAGRNLGLPHPDCERLRRAGWLHDIGRTGVGATLSLARGPLSDREREQLRLHPYHTGRILARGGELEAIGQLASLHHERLDGSGFAKGLDASALTLAARVLAAADRYCTLTEARPHRAALPAAEAASAMRDEVRAGRLDGPAAGAVLAAAGHAARSSPAVRPGGLTARECEVLRLLARGQTVKQAARELGLAPKTVDRHTQNIYTKIGVTTRAAATLYAVEQRLLD
ncbi:MAG: HD domain-containing protein [Burkholderiales bacterium]|nr:HD domain-containing protein [Burkholderiales bacterium]